MRIEYFQDTDSLYIEVDDGIVIDLDADGHAVGIDIDQASLRLDLSSLDLRGVPHNAGRPA